MSTEHELIAIAHEAKTGAEWREQTLALLCPAFDAPIGFFVAIEHEREVRTLRGVPAHHARALDAAWPAARRDVQPVKELARREGAATDRQVLGDDLARTDLFRRVMKPVGGTETLLLVPRAGEHPLGVLALGRCGGRFSAAALHFAKSLVPALSVACRAVPPSAPAPPRLTETDLDLLDYLELGWGTRDIASARGTSFFTVRNQLSALYRRLEVANRAEAIGICQRFRRAR